MPSEHQICVGICKIGSEVAIAAIHQRFVIAEPCWVLAPMVSAIVCGTPLRVAAQLVAAGAAVLPSPTFQSDAKSPFVLREAVVWRSEHKLYFFVNYYNLCSVAFSIN